MSSLKRAFTLVELLCVTAIVLLLAALVLPVLLQAKGEGKRAACLSQLRQIGLSLAMYREETGGMPKSHSLYALVQSGHLNDPRLLLCPQDPFDGLWRVQYMCLRYPDMGKESYYTPFRANAAMWDMLQKADDNPGIAVCRSHGAKSAWYSEARSKPCDHIEFAFEGPILRLRLDGSVKAISFDLRPTHDPAAYREFSWWRLFSDEEPKRGG